MAIQYKNWNGCHLGKTLQLYFSRTLKRLILAADKYDRENPGRGPEAIPGRALNNFLAEIKGCSG